MTEWMWIILLYTGLVLAAIGSLACVVLTLLQLPGTWLMLLLVLIVAWLTQGSFNAVETISLLIMLILAGLGELVEFIAGAIGSHVTGGTRRGAALSIVTAIAGAILGTFLIPVPIVGTLIGACVGAGAGSLVGDKWAGKNWKAALISGTGAAVGKFSGTVAKVALAGVMWIASLFALFGG